MTITNEDNMELMARYPDGYFDLAIVDPPYGIGYDGEVESMVASRGIGGKGYERKSWDDTAPSQEYFNELKRVSKNQIIWGANHFISKIPYDSSCWIIWDKKKGKFSLASAELAYTSFKTAVRIFEWQWHGFMQQGIKEQRIHPTQNPIKLYEWILMNYAKEGDKILDTHLGSGSIAIACHNLGFDLTACELDKEYYDAAMKRLKDHQKQLVLF